LHNVPVHAKATKLLSLDIQLNRQKSRSSKPSKRTLLSIKLRMQVKLWTSVSIGDCKKQTAEPSNLLRRGQLQRLKFMLKKQVQPQSSFLGNKWQEPYAQLDAEFIHTAMGSLAEWANIDRWQHKKTITNRKISKVTLSLMVGVMFRIMSHMMEY